MLDQVSLANQERFRAIAESDFAARRDANAAAPEPDLPELDETFRQRAALQTLSVRRATMEILYERSGGTRMETDIVRARPESHIGRWVKHGVVGGILAGIVFAMFEMVMAVVQMGADAFFMPLRMIGGIALGPQALDPGTSLVTAGGAGIVVHMMLSAMYGAGVAAVASVVPTLRSSTGSLVIWGSVAGLALWIINFYVIAPIAGWRWFPDATDPVIQFVAHTFVYGSLLGLYLDRTVRAR